jgi:hypothetical protein
MGSSVLGFDHINRNAPVLIRTPKLTRFEPAQYWGGGPPGNSVVLNPFFCLGGFFSCWSFWRLVRTWYTKPPCFHYRMHLYLILRGKRGAWGPKRTLSAPSVHKQKVRGKIEYWIRPYQP